MATLSASDDILLPGDRAPDFRVRDFLKGPSFDKLEPGTIHVVEFWASWCGPCVRSIPHVTELQARHPKVIFVGVGVRDHAAALEQFFAEHGDTMGYRVAVDAPGSTDDPKQGWMCENWLMAGGRYGIPDAFVVDALGRIVWMGMPKDLDDVLVQVEAGTWDMDAFRREHSGGAIATKAKMTADAKLNTLAGSKDWQALLTTSDAEFAAIPDLEQTNFMPKLLALSHIEPLRAIAYAEDLRDRYNHPDTLAVCTTLGIACNTIATQLDEAGHASAARSMREVGIRTDRQAVDLCERVEAERPGLLPAFLKGEVLNHLSQFHELNGDTAQAIRVAERTLAVAEERRDVLSHLMEIAQKRIERCQTKSPKTVSGGRQIVCDGDVCTFV